VNAGDKKFEFDFHGYSPQNPPQVVIDHRALSLVAKSTKQAPGGAD
jgi:hypothetical protein